MQLALPNWVRARGLAYYLVVFQGAQALGAMIWGTVADLYVGDHSAADRRGRPVTGVWWVYAVRCRTRPNSTEPRRRTGRPRN